MVLCFCVELGRVKATIDEVQLAEVSTSASVAIMPERRCYSRALVYVCT